MIRHFINHLTVTVAAPRNISTCIVNRMPKLYTRTGDKGTSSTFTGERRSKDDALFEALGATDELNCSIGLAREFAVESGLKCIDNLDKIQCLLQDAASSLATPKSTATEAQIARTHFSSKYVTELENWIDDLTGQLPPLRNFILPAGGKTSASLHFARARCRTAERRVVSLKRESEIDEEVLKYLNRLSDYLFAAARYACHAEGHEEIIYKRPDAISE